MKRQKDMTLEDEPPMLEGVQYGTRKKWRAILIAPERMKRLGQSRNDIQPWICHMVKVKSSAGRTILHRNLEYQV